MVDDVERRKPFTVVVTAGRVRDVAAEHVERALDWQDALVALADAVFERGGRLAAPANSQMVSVLAIAALPYARPPAAEAAGGEDQLAAPLQVFETGGVSEVARSELADLAHHGVLTYHDPDGERVALPRFQPSDEEAVPEPMARRVVGRELEGHHPVTPALLDLPDLVGVIVIGNTEELDAELALLARVVRVPVAVLVNSPVGETGGRSRRHSMEREFGGDSDLRDPMPYALVAETLVDAWVGGDGG